MKKITNKKKLSLATILTTILSFPFKVIGQMMNLDDMQDIYWVPPRGEMLYWVPSPMSPTLIVSKVIQGVLIWVTFIVWIINLIKIRKTDDKTQKRERIKETIIFMSILIILIVACFITTWLLKK